LALQDVDTKMGLILYSLKAHTVRDNAIFIDCSQKDEQRSIAVSRITTLKKGDAILFDATKLNCGNANDAEKGSNHTLILFLFSYPDSITYLI